MLNPIDSLTHHLRLFRFACPTSFQSLQQDARVKTLDKIDGQTVGLQHVNQRSSTAGSNAQTASKMSGKEQGSPDTVKGIKQVIRHKGSE